MKEIKFRAYYKPTKQIIYFDELGFDEEYALLCFGRKPDEEGNQELPHPYSIKSNNEDPNNWIVMQYTGLKDKNRKEIYEGDIINPNQREIRFGIYDCIDEKGESYSQGNGFYTICHNSNYRKMPFSFGYRQSENSEIIGNIYENQSQSNS